jgi:hypothetical protein
MIIHDCTQHFIAFILVYHSVTGRVAFFGFKISVLMGQSQSELRDRGRSRSLEYENTIKPDFDMCKMI